MIIKVTVIMMIMTMKKEKEKEKKKKKKNVKYMIMMAIKKRSWKDATTVNSYKEWIQATNLRIQV